jgi:hypothetical protein
MKATIILNLIYKSRQVAIIQKEFDLPNVFSGHSIKSNIALTDSKTITAKLKIDSIDIDNNIVVVRSLFGAGMYNLIDITYLVEVDELSAFMYDMEGNGWGVEMFLQTIEKLKNEKQKDEVVKPLNVKNVESLKATNKWFFFAVFISMLIFHSIFAYYYFPEQSTIKNMTIAAIVFAIVQIISYKYAVKRQKKKLMANE